MKHNDSDSYFYSEGGVGVAMGGGSVLIWDTSVPGAVAIVDELFGHPSIQHTARIILEETARKVLRDVAQRLGRVTVRGQTFYVARTPVEADKEWVYTPDRELAKVLTPHWQARFRAQAEANEWQWALESI